MSFYRMHSNHRPRLLIHPYTSDRPMSEMPPQREERYRAMARIMNRLWQDNYRTGCAMEAIQYAVLRSTIDWMDYAQGNYAFDSFLSDADDYILIFLSCLPVALTVYFCGGFLLTCFYYGGRSNQSNPQPEYSLVPKETEMQVFSDKNDSGDGQRQTDGQRDSGKQCLIQIRTQLNIGITQ